MGTVKVAKATRDNIDALSDFLNELEDIEENEYACDRDSLVWWIKSNIPTHWRKVTFGCEVLIDNACDPNLDYLEFKPAIREFLEEAEDKEPVDLW